MSSNKGRLLGNLPLFCLCRYGCHNETTSSLNTGHLWIIMKNNKNAAFTFTEFIYHSLPVRWFLRHCCCDKGRLHNCSSRNLCCDGDGWAGWPHCSFNQYSKRFGAEYDSLADMVAFGLAPALVMFEWALNGLGKFGWMVAFIYAACGALRLARFNTR